MLIFRVHRRHKLDHNWWSFDTQNHQKEQTEEQTNYRYGLIIRVTGETPPNGDYWINEIWDLLLVVNIIRVTGKTPQNGLI